MVIYKDKISFHPWMLWLSINMQMRLTEKSAILIKFKSFTHRLGTSYLPPPLPLKKDKSWINIRQHTRKRRDDLRRLHMCKGLVIPWNLILVWWNTNFSFEHAFFSSHPTRITLQATPKIQRVSISKSFGMIPEEYIFQRADALFEVRGVL